MRKTWTAALVSAVVLAGALATTTASAAPPELGVPAAGPGDFTIPGQPGIVLSDAHRKARAEQAAGGADKLAESAARVRQWDPSRHLKAVFDSAPSGHRPYGGDMWSGGTAAGNVVSCSYGMSTRATSGAQYGYTAGHCSRDDGIHDDINPTNGVFCVGYIAVCPSIDIGNTGHGGTFLDSTHGDQMFIRANKAWLGNGLRREVRTFDSRVTVSLFTAGNPIKGEVASCSCGMSGRLVGQGTMTVSSPSTVVQFAGSNGPVNVKVAVYFNHTGSPLTGCTQGGDSGGLMVSGSHDGIGVLSGHAQDLDGCWLFAGRAGDALTSVNQVPAPLP